VDNGWSHCGEAAQEWLRHIDSRIMLVYTSVNAIWLYQVDSPSQSSNETC
jgi:hypothetical protein